MIRRIYEPLDAELVAGLMEGDPLATALVSFVEVNAERQATPPDPQRAAQPVRALLAGPDPDTISLGMEITCNGDTEIVHGRLAYLRSLIETMRQRRVPFSARAFGTVILDEMELPCSPQMYFEVKDGVASREEVRKNRSD